MISIVIPLYNCELYIKRCIDSILRQTVTDFEIIIVDDGSSDNGPTIISEINHPSIRLVKQPNQGVSCARNRGIEEAQYDIIAFIDADDMWTETHLEDILHLHSKYPDCGVFGTSYTIQNNGKTIYPNITNIDFKEEDGVMRNYYEVASGKDFPFNSSSYAVKKEIIESIGGYPTGIPSGEDILTMARLNTVSDIAYTKKASAIYTINNKNVKSVRPILKHDPLDKFIYDNFKISKHKKGARLFLSSWHKRRMTGAFMARKYAIGFEHFFKAFIIFPFQKKLYTSFIISIISAISGKNINEINEIIAKYKN